MKHSLQLGCVSGIRKKHAKGLDSFQFSEPCNEERYVGVLSQCFELMFRFERGEHFGRRLLTNTTLGVVAAALNRDAVNG